jgi:RimJ/RimL family protein N-acetyltransferase
VIARGEKVLLRAPEPADLPLHLRWMSEGQWLDFDAPWEDRGEREAQRERFLKHCADEAQPRRYAIIETLDDTPIGYVIRYLRRAGMEDCWFLGIAICEDAYLDRGFGREALRLWISYLFENSQVHKLALDTWSLNPRMIHVAEALGFVFEGQRREEIRWKGQWLDQLNYGLLRQEWVAASDP